MADSDMADDAWAAAIHPPQSADDWAQQSGGELFVFISVAKVLKLEMF
jgi:hypothetical protein